MASPLLQSEVLPREDQPSTPAQPCRSLQHRVLGNLRPEKLRRVPVLLKPLGHHQNTMVHANIENRCYFLTPCFAEKSTNQEIQSMLTPSPRTPVPKLSLLSPILCLGADGTFLRSVFDVLIVSYNFGWGGAGGEV